MCGFFFIVTLHSPLCRPFTQAVTFFLFPSFAAKKSDIFLLPLSPYLSVSDEGRDLLSCLTVSAGLRDCSPPSPPLPPSLPACRPVWQCHPTTPVPRLQKPRLQLLRECQPVRAFPLVGRRTHCHTATLSLLAKFLSCFALLSFFLFFSYFLTLPLSWLFSLLATPSLCLHIALLSRFPQWPLSFLPLFFYSG